MANFTCDFNNSFDNLLEILNNEGKVDSVGNICFFNYNDRVITII